MALRSKFMKFMASSFTKVLGDRIQGTKAYEQTTQFIKNRFGEVKDKTTVWGQNLYQQFEGKRHIWADQFERELDVKRRYRRIQSKLAEDLAELEMRKSVLEKEVSADERMLFEEAYEHARKEIIERRMQQASAIFYPSVGQKLRDELLASITKFLRRERQSHSPKVDEA